MESQNAGIVFSAHVEANGSRARLHLALPFVSTEFARVGQERTQAGRQQSHRDTSAGAAAGYKGVLRHKPQLSVTACHRPAGRNRENSSRAAQSLHCSRQVWAIPVRAPTARLQSRGNEIWQI